jgi:hypothetical protein
MQPWRARESVFDQAHCKPAPNAASAIARQHVKVPYAAVIRGGVVVVFSLRADSDQGAAILNRPKRRAGIAAITAIAPLVCETVKELETLRCRCFAKGAEVVRKVA